VTGCHPVGVIAVAAIGLAGRSLVHSPSAPPGAAAVMPRSTNSHPAARTCRRSRGTQPTRAFTLGRAGPSGRFDLAWLPAFVEERRERVVEPQDREEAFAWDGLDPVASLPSGAVQVFSAAVAHGHEVLRAHSGQQHAHRGGDAGVGVEERGPRVELAGASLGLGMMPSAVGCGGGSRNS
jgi:hypothetical protein